MDTATWEVSNLEREASDDFVCAASYNVHPPENDGCSSSVNGAITFQRVGGSLIPYEDLTEDLVITWVKEALANEGIASTEWPEDIQLDTTILTGIPWR